MRAQIYILATVAMVSVIGLFIICIFCILQGA